MSNSSILPIDKNLSVATIPVQSVPGSNEGVLHIPQSSTITRASTINSLVGGGV